MIYNLIGRAVVKLGWRYIQRRVALRTVVLTAVGVLTGITVVSVAGYIATRDVPEA